VELTLPRRFQLIAAARPSAVAAADHTAEVTWRELTGAAEEVAWALRARGLEVGDRVVTAMEPSGAYLAVILGCLRAGLVPVPLNTRLTPHECRQYLAPIAPTVVVADSTFGDLASACSLPLVMLERAAEAGPLRARVAPLAGSAGELPLPEEDAVSIIFPTGGTTGTPKGAYWDHRRLWLWMAHAAATNPGDRYACDLYFSAFFHISLGTQLLARLFAGGRVQILRRFDPGEALAAIGGGATHVIGAPAMFAALRRHPAFPETRRSGMRAIRIGASVIDDELVRGLLADFPSAAIRTGYGATEFGPATGIEHADLLEGRFAGIGRPHPGVSVRVLRADGAEADPGEVGELVVAAPHQSLGYYARADETSATFRPEGVHSGDLGWADLDGWLHISGRSKDMIVTGGENVFPTEVEAVLRRHPSVADLIVFGVPCDQWGERVEVGVVAAGDGEPSLDELVSYGRANLAGYKLPKRLHRITAVPLTANQKPDRRAVRDMVLNPPS
jgi:fatty-acyl-CoA synthase